MSTQSGTGTSVFGVLADRFEATHDVVGEVTDGARGKRRQSGIVCGAMRAQQLLDGGEYIAGAALAKLAAFDMDLVACAQNLHVRARADESVTADVFAPLDRLQQEGVRLVGRDRQEGGDRREQVGASQS